MINVSRIPQIVVWARDMGWCYDVLFDLHRSAIKASIPLCLPERLISSRVRKCCQTHHYRLHTVEDE